MEGKRQCRCIVWIINWVLQIHCNPRVPLDANKLVIRIKQRQITEGYRGYMEFDIAFVSWVKVLLDLLKLSNFPSLDPVPKKAKICFSFQAMKNDWVWRKVFERFITIINVSVNIIQVLFFQVLSVFEKLHCKSKSFFIKELEILYQHLNKVYAPIYS